MSSSADPSPPQPPNARPAVEPADAPAEPGPKVVPRRVRVPPEPFDPLRAWSSLLIAVAVALPALWVALGEPEITGGAEARSLLRSRETWQLAASGREWIWLTPRANGEVSLRPPPMTVWLHMAAWSGLDPAAATPAQLTWRARAVSAGMAVLALMGTYWAGVSLGGVRMGRIAAMALGTTLLFIGAGRAAGPPAVLLALTTLAAAAGLWAMRPLRRVTRRGRRVTGWLLAGLAMGAAILTAGPVALLIALPPLIAAIVLTPRRRATNLIGMVFSALLGLILAAPWYLYVLDQVPQAWARLTEAAGPSLAPSEMGWSIGLAAVLLAPWQVWLIGGLGQPFLRAESLARRQQLIPWFWFLLAVAVALPDAHHPRDLLPALPAAALMVGQLWSYHAELASRRQHEPGINRLRVPHWLLMGAASVALPTLLALQPRLVERGWLEQPLLPGLTAPMIAGLGVALVLIVAAGVRWHIKWRPRLAAYSTVAWMVAALVVCLPAYARGPAGRYPHKQAARQVGRAADDRKLVYLYRTAADAPPPPAFLYYLGREVRAVGPDGLQEMAQDSSGVRLIVRDTPGNRKLMGQRGFEPVLTFRDGTDSSRRLYRVEPDAEPSPESDEQNGTPANR